MLLVRADCLTPRQRQRHRAAAGWSSRRRTGVRWRSWAACRSCCGWGHAADRVRGARHRRDARRHARGRERSSGSWRRSAAAGPIGGQARERAGRALPPAGREERVQLVSSQRLGAAQCDGAGRRRRRRRRWAADPQSTLGRGDATGPAACRSFPTGGARCGNVFARVDGPPATVGTDGVVEADPMGGESARWQAARSSGRARARGAGATRGGVDAVAERHG